MNLRPNKRPSLVLRWEYCSSARATIELRDPCRPRLALRLYRLSARAIEITTNYSGRKAPSFKCSCCCCLFFFTFADFALWTLIGWRPLC